VTKFELSNERNDIIVESDLTGEELRKTLEECGFKYNKRNKNKLIQKKGGEEVCVCVCVSERKIKKVD